MRIHTLFEFRQAASDFARGLKPLPDRATVVGLYGDLGSGKTTFVQAAAKALGVGAHISSPTFLIMKRFTIYDSGFKNLIHIDAYRLKSGEELRKLGFTDLLADPTNLIFVEWADHVAELLPKDHIRFFFEFVDDSTRSLTTTRPRPLFR